MPSSWSGSCPLTRSPAHPQDEANREEGGAAVGRTVGAHWGGVGALRGHCARGLCALATGPVCGSEGHKAQEVGTFSVRTQMCEKPCALPGVTAAKVSHPTWGGGPVRRPEQGRPQVRLPPSTRPCRSDS